jgi:hypothetical protein
MIGRILHWLTHQRPKHMLKSHLPRQKSRCSASLSSDDRACSDRACQPVCTEVNRCLHAPGDQSDGVAAGKQHRQEWEQFSFRHPRTGASPPSRGGEAFS